ncbi:MAG: aspartate carbamoyltransferase catalytic subunit [Chloroflexi bacterium]|nr:aspartate carbamoyltransferase catalytic subunit [Chloroflexota bacterium]
MPIGEVVEHRWHQRRAVLDLDDFSREEIEITLETAVRMREILGRPVRRVPALNGRTVINLFYEASTRTRVSFELAAKSLGADVVNVSASGSSIEKGETLLDTVRTLRSLGGDILVLRHPHAGAPNLVLDTTGMPVVNAGDGSHAHPTQALLDALTIRDHFGRVDGLKVLIVGDIAHSRVARSNAWGLSMLGARVSFCGPPTMLPATCLGPTADLPWPIQVELDLDRAMADAQVVMPLRIQWERQEERPISSLREYARDYGISQERLCRAPSEAVVLHPGPMNEGIEIAPEVAHGPQSLVGDQVTNGVAVRMAVLYLLVASTSDTADSASNTERSSHARAH